MKRRVLAALLLACLSPLGCTVINTARVPSDRSGDHIFVSAGDIPEPYESLGMIQVTRSGLLLFGFIDLVGTDLQAGFEKVLIPEIERLGGDGAINAHFHMTQYTPITKALFAFPFFFIPLPSEVTISAEVVRLIDKPDAAAEPSRPPLPGSVAPH
ncbi:MAG: hypothetical protein D6729_07580 [Deltaproteobacteria bacterium]|nr:MAG: hypothetical protein D6729_07580 [Deltaproteobacteria bacterium]